MSQSIFFIAVLVKGKAGEIITGFKQHAAEHFGASRALNSPPHLTLIPPFTWPEERLDVLKSELAHFVSEHAGPAIRLRNFNCFPPGVIFVDVESNTALDRFQEALENCLSEKLQIQSDRKYGFHPHVTVAFKDLRANIFPEAWQYYSKLEFEHNFVAEDIALLRHNGQLWEVLESFPSS